MCRYACTQLHKLVAVLIAPTGTINNSARFMGAVASSLPSQESEITKHSMYIKTHQIIFIKSHFCTPKAAHTHLQILVKSFNYVLIK